MGYLYNVKKLYLVTLFQALIPAYVIERLFWQERGMQVQQVVYCEIIYALTVVLLEIPSGVLADRFGRKRLLVINGAIAALEFLLLLFADRFWMFALVVFLSGVGKAFSSGSENALLYDSLLAENRQEDFEKLLGRLSALDFAGTMLAMLSGGVLAEFYSLELNYILSCASAGLAFVFTLFLREPPMVTRAQGEMLQAKQYTKQAALLFKAKPLVLLYCLSAAVLGSCLIYLDEFWQLLLEQTGVPVFLFGVVCAAEQLLRIPGNLFAYQLRRRFHYRTILTAVIFTNAAGYVALFLTRNVLCILPMLILSLAAGITDPLVLGYLHRQTESHIRSTAESFASLGLRLLSILVGLLFGYMNRRFSLFAGFAALAVVCTGYGLFFVLQQLFQKRE